MSQARSPESRRDADKRGREGEAAAAMYLAAQGWQIVAERVKTKAGEIGLIVRRAGLVAFVGVKWRARAAALGAAIDERWKSCGRTTLPQAKTSASTSSCLHPAISRPTSKMRGCLFHNPHPFALSLSKGRTFF